MRREKKKEKKRKKRRRDLSIKVSMKTIIKIRQAYTLECVEQAAQS